MIRIQYIRLSENKGKAEQYLHVYFEVCLKKNLTNKKGFVFFFVIFLITGACIANVQHALRIQLHV